MMTPMKSKNKELVPVISVEVVDGKLDIKREMKPKNISLDPKELVILSNNDCPSCKAKHSIIPGPCGGGSQNLLCGECKQEYCYYGFGADFMSRDPEQRKMIYGI